VDAQRDKLATVIRRSKVTTFVMMMVCHSEKNKFRVWNKVSVGSTLIFGDTQTPFQCSI